MAVEMIDKELIKRALKPSDVIKRIEYSWNERFNVFKNNLKIIPFCADKETEIECKINYNVISVCGYSGVSETLFITEEKGKMYALKSPIRYSPYKIYGEYNFNGNLCSFSSEPCFGAHYLKGNELCLGHITYDTSKIKTSYQYLTEVCNNVIKARRTINLSSLGTVYLPDNLPIKRILVSDLSSSDKINRMLYENIIESFL